MFAAGVDVFKHDVTVNLLNALPVLMSCQFILLGVLWR